MTRRTFPEPIDWPAVARALVDEARADLGIDPLSLDPGHDDIDDPESDTEPGPARPRALDFAETDANRPCGLWPTLAGMIEATR